jgi:hypothetical protein
MWLLVILSLVNASVNQKSFLLAYRLQIGGLPINIFDVLLIIAFLWACFAGRGARRMQTDRVHPLLPWILIFLFGALAVGSIIGIRNFTIGLSLRRYFTFIRDFACLPLGLVVGYRLLPHLRAAWSWRWVVILCGCVTAIMIILFFKGRGEDLGITPNLDALRAEDYVPSYAGIASNLLFYTLIAGPPIFKRFNRFFSVPLAGFCLVGNAATLNRSDWLAILFAAGSVFVALPKGRRAGAIFKGLIFSAMLAGFIMLGLYAAGRVTGLDFTSKMGTRVKSMLPFQDESSSQKKAWANRLPGMLREVELWSHSPVWGQGVGIQDSLMGESMEVYVTSRHNSWTCILAEYGLIGFTGAFLLIGGCLLVGWRMCHDRLEVGSTFVGALGMITAVHFAVLGFATNGFVSQRPAMLLGITCGMVLRARAMQLTVARQYAAGYLDADPSYDDLASLIDENGGTLAYPDALPETSRNY